MLICLADDFYVEFFMQLEIVQEGQKITTIPLEPGLYTIGRSQENTISLDDNGISRLHAQLEVSPDLRVKIVDLQSTNGCWLGNQKINTAHWDETGLALQLGACQLFLRNVQKPEQPPSPQPMASLAPPDANGRSTFSSPSPNTFTEQPMPEDPSSGVASLKPTHRVISDKPKKKNWSSFLNVLSTLCLLLIIGAFAAFVIWKQTTPTLTMVQEIEQTAKEKIKEHWLASKGKVFEIKLVEVEEYIKNNNLQPAQDLLFNVMQKDPGNTRALANQEIIKEKQQANKEAAIKIAEEKQLKEEEKLRAQHQKRISQLKIQAQRQMQTEDYAGCVQTAQELLKISPNNTAALDAIDGCSKSIQERKRAANSPEAKNAAKKKLEETLQGILQEGETQLRKKRYRKALQAWNKVHKVDPNKESAITLTIVDKITKLRSEIKTLVKKNIRLGKNARKKRNYTEAITYFRRAHKLQPSNKDAKQWYDSQLRDNFTLAEELYNESIAYASLGSMDSARNAIGKAEKLAQGNRKLLQMINKKMADFAKR